MTGFLDPVDLNLQHVRVIVRGMVRVAKSDGAHERELVLIREFYEACRSEVKGLADFADVINAPFDVEEGRDALSSELLKRTFFVSAYLVAYADGRVTPPELQVIEAMAAELAVEPSIAAEARELVKDQLLMQLARSSNLDALKHIASQM